MNGEPKPKKKHRKVEKQKNKVDEDGVVDDGIGPARSVLLGASGPGCGPKPEFRDSGCSTIGNGLSFLVGLGAPNTMLHVLLLAVVGLAAVLLLMFFVLVVAAASPSLKVFMVKSTRQHLMGNVVLPLGMCATAWQT